MFKFNRLWIMNLITAIVLAMLVACQAQSDTVDLATPTRLAETPTPSATLPEASLNTTQWPTFRSESLGFSLSYPPDWTVSEVQRGVNLDSSESFGGGPEPMQYYVYIGAFPNPQARVFADVATEGLSDVLKRIFTFTPKMIGSYQAYETIYMPSRSGALTVFFAGDRRYLAIALTPYDEPPRAGQDKYVRLFRALLETIRLTR